MKIYINGNVEEIWDSAFNMCDLFHDITLELEDKWGLDYNQAEAKASYHFLNM